ncbi:hypothetical protein MTR67_002084 [Solanum verrucosum]|uniref:Uncharacterized protein n=1 Tax=Solanum verrucosum TaxID=315347 RepID=A0AAF0PPE6_SOLVR|nr:hypothetical protein MTR67_002084 [Solanum verrucosum]
MMPVHYQKAPPLLAFGWYIFIRTDIPFPGDAAFVLCEQATLALDMANQEIGMDPREGTSRSPPGQRDRFPSEAHGGSPLPLVPACPTPIEAQGGAVPPSFTSSIGT